MNRFIVIDLETTGNQPDNDAITQVGAVLIEDNQIIDEFSSYVYTDKEIPLYIQNLTGITPEDLEGAPTIDEVLVKLLPFFEGSIFVAHNAPFDLAFIQNALEEEGYAPFSGLVLDTLDLSRILLPMAQSYKLNQIAEELEIMHENPHRADDDAKATADLLIKLITQLQEMPLVYLQRIQEIIKNTHKDLAIFVDNTISTKFMKNINVDDDSYHVVNQIPLQNFIEEEIDEKGEDYEISHLEAIFDNNGLLFDHFPDFELRPSQKEMAEEVWQAFVNNYHLMVEAGTGTGKSLAYLIPALFYAKEHDEKIVIATHTINLQEQLFNRDIPLLKKILPFDFSATILKGRNNYLCLRKYEQQLNQSDLVGLNKEGAVDLAQLFTWISHTTTGDVEEINLSLSGRNLWNQIRSDADSCLNRQCPWFRNCFYHKARNKAQTADIIITNHSLLLTNLKADHRILPAYNRLVIDEAHQFQEVAIKHLGIEINQYQTNSLLTRFYRDAKSGFLVNLVNILIQSQDPDQFAIANQIQNSVFPTITKVDLALANYFNLVGEFVNQHVRNQDFGRKTQRITQIIKKSDDWSNIIEASQNVFIELTEWINQMDEVGSKLKALELEENLLVDFVGHLKDLKEFSYNFSEWNYGDDPNKVYWVETIVRGKRYSSYFYATPIDIGPYLKEALFDKLDSVIMTSATLSVNKSFNYASREFGFEDSDEELKKIRLTSPFNYKEQAVVYIPKDVPAIQEVSENSFIDHITKNIADIAKSLDGRTLVLFTSHSMLQKSYDLLKVLLEPEIKVLGHGIDSNSRSKLTKRFAENSNTILLGTNSFWEGVDIPGDALSALIIVKLPFTPPNNPIHEAKTERLKEQGKNSFMELSVPQAVIRFKQGFGRLIRSRKDKGVVVIFDKRIVETRYGKAFLNSLPALDVYYQPFAKIMDSIEIWIYDK